MTARDWEKPALAALGFRLDGEGDSVGHGVDGPREDACLVLMNGEPAPLVFTMPEVVPGERWRVLLDTGDASRTGRILGAGANVVVDGGGLVVAVVAH